MNRPVHPVTFLLVASPLLFSRHVLTPAHAAETGTTTPAPVTTHSSAKTTPVKAVTAIRDEHIIVTAHLDKQRASLQPSTGASVYHFTRADIERIPGGDNAPLNTVLLQAPGVTQDSYGQIHIRGDHNEVQFRLDGVALPEGLSVFGQTLMTRFAHSMSLTTGALPSEYGFLQAGVIDITTKNGTSDSGGNASIYGGARDYFFPSLQYGGHSGKWDYFATADFVHNRVGIENPTPDFNAIHDLSNQYHFLGHLRYTADENTRISFIAGVSNAQYELPNNPGQQRQFANPSFLNSALSQQVYGSVDSASLREQQKEITDFGILSLQKEMGKLSLQTSAITRYSSLGYSPDPLGDLVYNGIAQHAQRSIFSSGNQTDLTWRVAPKHTIRFGFQAYVERTVSKSDATVYTQSGTDDDGNAEFNGLTQSIHDGTGRTGWVYGLYAQDEWRPLRNLTINYGLRFDGVDEYTHSKQVSPRINIVWTPWKGGTFHAGYSRYFTPPPFELVGGTQLNKYADTSGAPPNFQNTMVKSERDHYFDAGFAQEILPHWHASFDAYVKLARNMIDEGQFGSPIILSAFNYKRGQVNGYEVTTDYSRGPFTVYGNFAWSRAIGKNIVSAQWNMAPDDLAYISNHWVHVDHDQRWTASAGGSYTAFHKTGHPLRLSATMVYGSGLREDSAIPNGASVPNYVTFNLGLVQSFDNLFHTSFLKRTELRLDVTNLFDRRYMLRSGSGIGVGAPQYGLRRTILTGISQRF
ncbi:TonB-dependent receptor [Acetobacter sp.]|jgi:outer membrane receptor protein involved in Fe transport|uniref:TonB-dependent receptor n=1 Tax=Acetobacter sp. TaxID=440 RepID=UPI0025C0EA2E|nr:TonB-dependent receptor [Acetobacter sp.]MCH4092624.1 TonB-dependent receptor [Acetobacter sp.]MCI1299758.1 TonB-dependent receptor [Acetobacter sp.]MCI1315362.1 TonB-dependent receptor [Acetobacter sp.]